MFNPSDLQLNNLPWLPLDAKGAFPKQPCIYFAIDSQEEIQYIGRTVNAKQRWASHHRYSDLEAIGGIRIAYLFLDADLLPAVEIALIEWFSPSLNRLCSEKSKLKPVAKDYRVKPGAWGESKQRVQIMLTPTAIERVDTVADEMKLTRAEVIERLIRSNCLDPEKLASIGDEE